MERLNENNTELFREIVLETEHKLYNEWIKYDTLNLENTLLRAIQLLKRQKAGIGEQVQSVTYYTGMLDGIVKVFSKLLQEKKEEVDLEKKIGSGIKRVSPQVQEVFSVLRESEDWVCHKDLAEKIGTSVSSLSNIMNRLIKLNAVLAVREGKHTLYKLTTAGERYSLNLQSQKQQKNNYKEKIDSIYELLSTFVFNTSQETREIYAEIERVVSELTKVNKYNIENSEEVKYEYKKTVYSSKNQWSSAAD